MSARLGLGVALEYEDKDGGSVSFETFFFLWWPNCINNEIQQRFKAISIIAFGD